MFFVFVFVSVLFVVVFVVVVVAFWWGFPVCFFFIIITMQQWPCSEIQLSVNKDQRVVQFLPEHFGFISATLSNNIERKSC